MTRGSEYPPPPPDSDSPRRAVEGDEGRRGWDTITPQRRVVAVVRNPATVTALDRLLRVAFPDTRVQLAFSIPPDRSAFSGGLEQRLASIGATIIPWHELSDGTPDLLIAASYAGQPFNLDVPTVFTAHGYGRTRDPRLGEEPREGDVPASSRVVHLAPHRDQVRFLPAWGESRVVGDPIYDDVAELRGRRVRVRDELEVGHRTLVVVTSTWRTESLFGRHPRLLADITRSLPMDEYVVAAILHPNIRARHSSWQIDTWLQPALRNGLRLIPDGLQWRPVTAAADVVIGDHGSVTFFADLLGLPLLRCHGNLDELTTGSVLEQRARSSTRLDVDGDIHQQVREVEAPSSEEAQRFRDLAIDHQGESVQRFRDLAYELMELDQEPLLETSRAAAIPLDIRSESPAIYRVRVDLNRDAHVTATRLPGPTPLGRSETIVGTWGEAATSALQCATVVALSSLGEVTANVAKTILTEIPGCRVVASTRSRECILIGREGRQSWRSADNHPDESSAEWAATLAAVLQWLPEAKDLLIERQRVIRRFVLQE